MLDPAGSSFKIPSSSDWLEFHSRLYSGDTEAVREWFQEFKGTSIAASYSWTTDNRDPVCVAVETNSEVMVDILLENGFSSNHWEFPGRGSSVKPIHIAARNGHVSMLKKLIDIYSVPADTPDSVNITPLLTALINYQCAAARFLLSRNTSVNHIENSNGLSPLVAAVGCRDVELLKEILAAGADVNLNTSRWECALNRAVLMRRLDLVKVLCEGGARTDIRLQSGNTVLHIALAYPSDIRLIKYLIDINTSFDAVTDKGHTAVHKGLCEASSEHVHQWLSLMLEAGYQVTQKDYDVACERFSGEDGKLIREQLKLFLNHSRTLKQLCCLTVRRILAGRFLQAVDFLPLPSICKMFLRLDHLTKI